MAFRLQPIHAIYTTVSVSTLALLSYFLTPYMMLATFGYGLLITGLIYRKTHRRLHARFMTFGIFTDLGLVLALEFQRGAIDTAFGFTLTYFQQAHVATSSLAALLYIPVLVMGYLLLQRRAPKHAPLRVWHVRLALTAFVFRTLGFLLMFSLMDHVR